MPIRPRRSRASARHPAPGQVLEGGLEPAFAGRSALARDESSPTQTGAGLALLACATTAGHFAVVLGYPAIASRLPASRPFGFAVRVVYEDGRGILRDVLSESTRRGFAVQRVTTQQLESRAVGGVPAVAVTLEVHGQPAVESL